MNYFQLTKKQNLLQNSVATFAKKHISPYIFELDRSESLSEDLINKFYQSGCFGLQLSQSIGGRDLNTLDYILTIEQFSKVDGSQASTIASHNSLGAQAINCFGTSQQKDHLLCQFTPNYHFNDPTDFSKEAVNDHHKPIKPLWGFALTEQHAGSDLKAINTYAKYCSTANCFILNGSKQWITNCANPYNAGVTVLAKTSSDNSDNFDGFTLFLLEHNQSGLNQTPIKNKLMWRAGATAKLNFDNIKLSKNSILGKYNQGLQTALSILDGGRLSIAAMGLGLAKGAYNTALDYAKKRTCFGKPIIEHQAIGFKLADMAMNIHAGETLLYKACWMKCQNQNYRVHSSMAKLFCSELAELCARDGLQILGSKALQHGSKIELFYRDATILRIGEGTSEIQKKIIARNLSNIN